MLFLLVVFGVMHEIAGTKPRSHYCDISKEHTMCVYVKANSMNLRCWYYHSLREDELMEYILDKHNSLRNNYAFRSEGHLSIPNMQGLEWDSELAELARRWAMQCPLYEDENRDVDRFKVAQAVRIVTKSSSVPLLREVWKSLIRTNITFHKRSASRGGRPRNELKCGFRLDVPLTLITNPYLKYVGCASSSYRQIVNEERATRTILVCNYGPLEDSYARYHPAGPPCTLCPNNTSCDSNSPFPNLCFGTTA
uniref:SCP domain-containing protein n=1 Tax=Lygus hesperus TaxID=30085 RepID=A0A0A9X1I9_LYGHE